MSCHQIVCQSSQSTISLDSEEDAAPIPDTVPPPVITLSDDDDEDGCDDVDDPIMAKTKALLE